MVLIHTGIEKLDETLNKNIPDSKIAFYADFLLQEQEPDTVIISPHIDINMPFKDFLFALRQQDKRIIILMGTPESEYLGYVLALGIYDIIFDPVTIEKVTARVNNPAKFSDVQGLFLGLKGAVSFEGNVEEKEVEKDDKKDVEEEKVDVNVTEKKQDVIINNISEKEHVTKQIEGILKVLDRKPKNKDVCEMLVELEDAVMDVLL